MTNPRITNNRQNRARRVAALFERFWNSDTVDAAFSVEHRTRRDVPRCGTRKPFPESAKRLAGMITPQPIRLTSDQACAIAPGGRSPSGNRIVVMHRKFFLRRIDHRPRWSPSRYQHQTPNKRRRAASSVEKTLVSQTFFARPGAHRDKRSRAKKRTDR